ncbi:hypothetical protein HZD82_24690, partial [Pantoea agglomerans]|nr:hypothetical protein [Pantoea agglomerans]
MKLSGWDYASGIGSSFVLLLLAAITFIVTLFLPPGFWVSGVKAIAEAAMVGALADW